MNQAERRRQVLLAWAYLQRQQGELIPTNNELSQIAMVRAVPPGLRTPVVNRWAHVLHHLMWLSDQGHPDPVADARRMAPAGPPLAGPPQAGPPQGPPPRQQPTQPSGPEETTTQVPTGRVAGAVPRPTPQPGAPVSQPSAPVSQPSASMSPPGPVSQPSAPVSQPSAPVSEPLDPVQRLMVWRDRDGHQDLKDRHIRQIINSGARNAAEVAAGLPVSLKSLAPAIARELDLTTSPSAPGPSAPDHPDEPATPPQPGRPGPGAGDEPAVLNPNAVTWQEPARLAEEIARFADLDFSQPTGEAGVLKVSTRAENLVLSWPAVEDPAPVTLYRVVSDDDHLPYSPDLSDVIGITTGTTFTDSRPFHSAVRHYQVWVNQGASVAEAMLEQPTLHVGLPVVAKPTGVEIREDEGRVVGHWTVSGEARRVQIFRVPAERPSGMGNPAHRICVETDNLNGFVDDGAESGQRYLYQLLVEAEVDGGARLSQPTVVPVATSARLVGVPDLACERHEREGAPRFDLEWTMPPQGRVVIYRTAAPPLAGADAETVDESALPRMNLDSAARLNYPSDVAEGRARVRDVPWPQDWHRTYFTPVTLFGGQARVGRTTSAVHVGRPGDPRLVERVSEQVLTMEWPDGADSVKVYAAARGDGSAEDAIAAGATVAEISREQYQRLGGLHFRTPLDPHGCSLHLLPLAFSRGEAVHGTPVTLDYPGLLRMHYSIEARPGQGRERGRMAALIRVRSEWAYEVGPQFALIHNPQRLPLDVGDGENLQVHLNTAPPSPAMYRFRPQPLTQTWSEPGWLVDVTGRTGWLRVFIDHPTSPGQGTIALLDPPVVQLHLGGGR